MNHSELNPIGHADRYLITPALSASLQSGAKVSIVELSLSTIRLRSDRALHRGDQHSIRIDELGYPVDTRILWSRPGPGGASYSAAEVTAGSERIHETIVTFLEEGKAELIDELRVADRFRIEPPLQATFGAAGEVEIIDMSETGVRLRHNATLRPASTGTLKFRLDLRSAPVDAPGKVVWSQAVQTNGRLSYSAGVRLENASHVLRPVIQTLASAGRATLDAESLVIKLQIMRTRALQRARELSAHIRQQSVRTDEYLLIEHVREQLRTYPDEATQWYNRAKYSASEESVRGQLPPTLSHKEEVLAIWEYLERSVDLGLIVRFFQELTEARSRQRPR